jgi:hypothetical protein
MGRKDVKEAKTLATDTWTEKMDNRSTDTGVEKYI